MLKAAPRIIKWISIPTLLLASLFSHSAEAYESALNLVVCLGSVVFVRRAAGAGEYYWATAFVALAVFFSPVPLISKIFLLMALTCVATLATLIAVFRPRPVAHAA